MPRRFRIAAIHAALIAIFLRALLPLGWMPDAQNGFIVCSTTLGLIHHDSNSGNGSDHSSSHEECPFAAAPHLAAVPDLPTMMLPTLHAAEATVAAIRAGTIAARFSPQSPRAPPLTV